MTVFDIIPILAIVAVMYFFLWRPQQQERESQESMLASLSKDERIVTIGGLHATIVEVGATTVVVEIGDRTRVTLEKSAVARKVPPIVVA